MYGMGKLFAAAAATVSGKVFFSEQFNDGWRERWVDSEWKKADGSNGAFDLAAGKHSLDESDKGLHTTQDAKHYTISTSFDEFSNEGKTLIVQYQVKYEQDIECGGGYLKIGPKPDDLKKFGDPTPYNIMFGPDQCGFSSKRTHLIFNYKGKNLLRKTDLPYEPDKGASHIYRLVLKSDSTYEVFVDGESKGSGKLAEDFDFLLPKKVNDPKESKPESWVDEKKIDDPEDKVPDDWVKEKRITDKDAKKPDDWDDEEDGEWEPPMKDNPDFKGEWKANRIDNPAYKGEWIHPQIDNPDYVDDDKLYLYKKFGFVGFDLWQVKSGTIFDNIILTDDVAEADKFQESWKKLNAAEKEKKAAEEEAERKTKEEDDKKKKASEKDEDDDDIDAATKDDDKKDEEV